MARFVYLDEAGTGGEPWLVVSGAIVHADHQLDRLYSALAEVLIKHIPGEKRDGLVLHSSDVYGGNGPVFHKDRFPEWTWDKRAAILDDLAALPQRLNLWVTGAWIELAKFPLAPLEIPKAGKQLAAHVCAYAACLTEIDLWFRQNATRENCLVIMEDNPQARQVLKDIHAAYQDPIACAALAQQHQVLFPFRRIREDAAFQEKRPSHPLVLADFLAFTSKRKLMGDPRIDRFCRPWWKRNAGLHVIVPKST